MDKAKCWFYRYNGKTINFMKYNREQIEEAVNNKGYKYFIGYRENIFIHFGMIYK